MAADRTTYQKTQWVNDETPLDEEHLNHLEDGVEKNNALSKENAAYLDELFAALIEQAFLRFDNNTKKLVLSIGSTSGDNPTQRFNNILEANITFDDLFASLRSELIAKMTTPFDKIVEGSNVDLLFDEGEIVWCSQGTIIEGGDAPSSLIISLPQTTKKALYLHDIEIEYVDQNGDDQVYTHTFEITDFAKINDSNELDGITWSLQNINETTNVYFGWNNTLGIQIGSSSKPAKNLSLSTSDFAGCTIKSISLACCGGASNNAVLSILVGADQWEVSEGQGIQVEDPETHETSEDLTRTYIASNSVEKPESFSFGEDGTTLSSSTKTIYEDTFLSKEDDEIIEIEPIEDVVYLNRSNNAFYRFDGEQLIVVSSTLELGTTSNTAYRGDHGQQNYQNIQNILNGNTNFGGYKVFIKPLSVSTLLNEKESVLELSSDEHNTGDVLIRASTSAGLTDFMKITKDENADGDGFDLYSVKHIYDLAEPEADDEAATKYYVDTGLESKLDKVTTTTDTNQVYVKTTNGGQVMFDIAVDPSASTIPFRTDDGTLRTATPKDNNDAANKQYVDGKVTKANLVSILGEVTQQLSGLMSATDKAHLDTLYALLGESADADQVVNTLNEVLAIFANYPESTLVLNSLAAKVNKSGDTMTGALGFQDTNYIYYVEASGSDSLLFKRGTTVLFKVTANGAEVDGDLLINNMGSNAKSAATREYVDSVTQLATESEIDSIMEDE